jgi:3-methyladenine DNA glycosylase AlkD
MEAELSLPDPASDWTPDQVVGALSSAFNSSVAGSEYRHSLATVVPGAGQTYGVKVPVLRALARQVIGHFGRHAEALVMIADAAWKCETREHRLMAVMLLERLPLPPDKRWAVGESWLAQVGNWEICDAICGALLGKALCQDPSRMDQLEAWASRPDQWHRRAAVVTPVYLRQHKYEASIADDLDRRTLDLCGSLLDDPEKYVRKAVDWSLRGMLRRRYALAAAWMMKQAAAGHTRSACTILNQASRKLNAGDRKALLKLLETD